MPGMGRYRGAPKGVRNRSKSMKSKRAPKLGAKRPRPKK